MSVRIARPALVVALVTVALPATALSAVSLTKPRVVTGAVNRQLGTPPTAVSAKALMARFVAATRRSVATAGDGGPARVAWSLTVRRSGAGVPSARGTITVRGLADDSLAGWNTIVTMQRRASGAYDPIRWRIQRAERRDACSRGVTFDRAKCL